MPPPQQKLTATQVWSAHPSGFGVIKGCDFVEVVGGWNTTYMRTSPWGHIVTDIGRMLAANPHQQVQVHFTGQGMTPAVYSASRNHFGTVQFTRILQEV
jgi:hypothetical protein